MVEHHGEHGQPAKALDVAAIAAVGGRWFPVAGFRWAGVSPVAAAGARTASAALGPAAADQA